MILNFLTFKCFKCYHWCADIAIKRN